MFRKLASRTAFMVAVASLALLGIASPANAGPRACLYERYSGEGAVVCTSLDNYSYHDYSDHNNDRFNDRTQVADRVSSVNVLPGNEMMLWTDHHYSGHSLHITGSRYDVIEWPNLGNGWYDNAASSHFFF